MKDDKPMDDDDFWCMVIALGFAVGVCWGTCRLAAVGSGYSPPTFSTNGRDGIPAIVQGLGALFGWTFCGTLMGAGLGIPALAIRALISRFQLPDIRWFFRPDQSRQALVELEQAHQYISAIKTQKLKRDAAVLVGSLEECLHRAKELL